MHAWNTSLHMTSKPGGPAGGSLFVPMSAVELPRQYVVPTHDDMKTQVRGAMRNKYFESLPQTLATPLNAARAYLIVAHGCSMNAHFTLPRGTRLVYLVPPSCDMSVESQPALVRNPFILEKILDFRGPTSFRSGSTEYLVQRYEPGARVLDQVLTFSHDTGYAGVYKLPLHRDVIAANFNRFAPSVAATLAAAAQDQELTKLNYARDPNVFLSEYLNLLGPGTYVLAACRGSCTNSVTTGIEARLGRHSPIAVEQHAWMSGRLNAGGALPNMNSGTVQHNNRKVLASLLSTTGSGSNDSNYESNSERRAPKRTFRNMLLPSPSKSKSSEHTMSTMSVYGQDAIRARMLQRRRQTHRPDQRRVLGELSLQNYYAG